MIASWAAVRAGKRVAAEDFFPFLRSEVKEGGDELLFSVVGAEEEEESTLSTDE